MSSLRKITDWYFSRQALPYWCVLLIDCAIVIFSCYVGHYLEIGGMRFAQNFWAITWGNLISIIPFIISFHLLHTYSGIIRYSSFVDLQRVAIAVLCGSLLTFALGFIYKSIYTENHAILFLGVVGTFSLFVCATLLMWLERVIVKRLFDTYNTEDAISVAIYGTKAGGVSIAKSISCIKEKRYVLRLFVSDEEEMKNTYLMGSKVILNKKGIGAELKKNGIKALLVSPLKSNLFRNNQAMIDELLQVGVKIMMMPAAEEWDGKINLTHQQLREVEIEDLLPREKIEIDMDTIGSLLRNKRILITGAAGSIGSEMSRQVAKFAPSELILVDQAETPMHDVRLYMSRHHKDMKIWSIVGNITNQEQMETIFAKHKPEYVFHAAAYKHVPMMEDNPAVAVQNNIYGTRVIADLAVKYQTKKFVMISTDKAVNPTNVMGCSKRICEIYCQSLSAHQQTTQFITTRFGNVLGSNGSVIPIFKEQIQKGGPVMVTHHHITRFFMLIPEACRLVLEAGTIGKGGEIFVFDMGAPIKIIDLAKRMIQLSGAKNIEIQFSGLRDGEKLYEEVLNDAEQTKPTTHPKIKVAAVRKYPYELALQNEIELHELAKSFNDMLIVKKMKEIVPEYKSQHSTYEQLDK